MFNKILIGVTSFSVTSLLGIITYISSDTMDNIKSIEHNVSTIKTQQIVAYEHQKNTDSRVEQIEVENKEHYKEFNRLKERAYTYWGKPQ